LRRLEDLDVPQEHIHDVSPFRSKELGEGLVRTSLKDPPLSGESPNCFRFDQPRRMRGKIRIEWGDDLVPHFDHGRSQPASLGSPPPEPIPVAPIALATHGGEKELLLRAKALEDRNL